jgi:hypothetical protein
MTFKTLLRTVLLCDMTVNAEAMHGFIAVIALMTDCTLLYPVGIGILVMAVNTFHAHILVGLMGEGNDAELALHGRNTISSYGKFCGFGNGHHVRIFPPRIPGVQAAGRTYKYEYSGYGRRYTTMKSHGSPPFIFFAVIRILCARVVLRNHQ